VKDWTDENSEMRSVLKENLDRQVPAEVEQRLRARLVAFRQQMRGVGSPAASRGHRVSVRRWRWAFAVGAAAAVLLVGVFHLFRQGEDGAALAYAAVLQQVRAAQTATCQVSVQVPGQPLQALRCTFVGPTLMRCDLGEAGAAIIDFGKKEILILDRTVKTFTVAQLDGVPHIDNLIERLRNLPDKMEYVESLGERPFDGRSLTGFRYSAKGITATLWVDPRANELTRAEFQIGQTTATMSDFAFDVPVDQSLLSLEAPQGYTRQETRVDVADLIAEASGSASPTRPEAQGTPPGVLKIWPSRGLSGPSMYSKAGEYYARGYDVMHMIQEAYFVSRPRIVLASPLPEGLYDVFLKMPEGREAQLWEAHNAGLRAELEKQFGITGHTEKREMEVYVLTAPGGRTAALRDPESTTHGSYCQDGKYRNVGLGFIEYGLGGVLKKAVLDETGLTGHYDFELACKGTSPEAAIAAVQEQLGLKLALARRSIDVLVIERAKTQN